MSGYGVWLRAANHGWGSWCVHLGFGFAFTPPILAGVLGRVYLCVRSPSTASFLAGVCSACVQARPLASPRQIWLGCVVWVCVCRLWFWLHPAILAEVLVCVCLCGRSAFFPPFLAGVCGMGVCDLTRVLAAPRHSRLGCWGVCDCVRTSPVPCHWWLRSVVRVSGFGFWPSPRQSWLKCWGVCVCFRVPPVARLS